MQIGMEIQSWLYVFRIFYKITCLLNKSEGEKHMFKKSISMVSIIALILSVVLNTSFAAETPGVYRQGFKLIPNETDTTGVSPDSTYKLISEKQTNLSNIKGNLTLEGEPAPEVTQNDNNTFIVRPAVPLLENKLYTFKLKTSDGNQTSWTFQTSWGFKVLSSFPRDKSTGVPTNSGVELLFTQENYGDLKDYFEITPYVKGKFEKHKSTTVFVPQSLKENTLYTVTIKKGLKLVGTKKELKEDYTFQFETEPKKTTNTEATKSFYFSYGRNLEEFSTNEKPDLPFYYSVYDPKNEIDSINIKTEVFVLKDQSAFLNALKKSDEIPYWAYNSRIDNKISTSGLAKVTEFTQEFKKDNYSYQTAMKIPTKLEKGFYLVSSSFEKTTFQTLIQVTDVAVYMSRAENKTLLWLNDISTGKAIKGALVKSLWDNQNLAESNDKGIATFSTPKSDENKNTAQYYSVTTDDGKTVIVSYYQNYNYLWWNSSPDIYWNYTATDRNLYKPDDTINFWGFLKNRYENENIENVTVEITNGYSAFWMRPMAEKSLAVGGAMVADSKIGYFPYKADTLFEDTIKVTNGVFTGNIDIPSLSPGGYQLVVKKGDEIISSNYISIENYTKPDYMMSLTPDKQAIFLGESVKFTANTAFFEGTAVPNLLVNYNINSGSSQGLQGKGKTDGKGNLVVNYKPVLNQGEYQGIDYIGAYFNVNQPQMGNIYSNSGIRLFVNDMNVTLDSQIKDGKGILKAKVNEIVLDRINNGTAKDTEDFLGNPISGKTIKGTIYRNSWQKFENGTAYDYINKTTYMTYRYELVKEKIEDVDITTDSKGEASFLFNAKVPTWEDYFYYTAELNSMDNNGRSMTLSSYFGTWYNYYPSEYTDNRYYLDSNDKTSFDIDEKIDLIFKHGTKPLTGGSYLFIKSQNGIRNAETSDNSSYSTVFTEVNSPNTTITGVYFNGVTYVESESFNAQLDFENRKLKYEITTDKTEYKPGETANVTVKVTDLNGNAKIGTINLSLVDEALFALNNYTTDALYELYAQVPSGIDFTYSSHRFSNVTSGRNEVLGYGGDMKEARADSNLNVKSKSEDAQSTAAITDTSVRENFKDTAWFKTVKLNKDGTAKVKIELPDNVTSWRLTSTGISDDLYAGTQTSQIKVSQPFFISYSLNTTYLSGDKPIIGVNAYGNDLNEGEEVIFEVTDNMHPGEKLTAKGSAFERIDIPLWSLKEGINTFTITATSKSGLKDAIKHTANVFSTYHQIDGVSYFTLKNDIKLSSTGTGNSKVVFIDKSRGKYFSTLINMLYSGGNRIDQKLSVNGAVDLLKKYFNENYDYLYNEGFNPSQYQTPDGGISILPYGNSDTQLSAILSTLIKDKIDKAKLTAYFYNVLNGNVTGERGAALYGLAVLKAPILVELDKSIKTDNAGIKDVLFMALAYAELGETSKAKEIFKSKIEKEIESIKPYLRIDTGTDNDDVIDCTALAAVLASKLDLSQKSGLYNYCIKNAAKDIFVNIQKLLYLTNEIDNADVQTPSFTYNYFNKKKNVSLTNGRAFSMTIPTKLLSNLKISNVKGNAGVAVVSKKPVEQGVKLDKYLNISRQYFVGESKTNTNSFKQGDIVRVEIKWNINNKSIDGTYDVTDYLPSGLKPLENYSGKSGYWYKEIDGQKIKFTIYKGDNWSNKTLVYYARVISSGTYKSEATIVQGVNSRNSINFGKDEVVTIK